VGLGTGRLCGNRGVEDGAALRDFGGALRHEPPLVFRRSPDVPPGRPRARLANAEGPFGYRLSPPRAILREGILFGEGGRGAARARLAKLFKTTRLKYSPLRNIDALLFVSNTVTLNTHPSVRLCVGPELARCVHYTKLLQRGGLHSAPRTRFYKFRFSPAATSTEPLSSAVASVVNSDPHIGAHPSVRLYVGLINNSAAV
jgi:hypothetical protein